MTDSFYELIVRYRYFAIVCCVAVAGVLGAFTKLEIDSSLRIWFLDDDPDVAAYDEFISHFETDEFIAIAIVDDGGIFQSEVLAELELVAEAAAEVDGIHQVISLSNAQIVESDGATLSVSALYDEIPEGSALAELHETVRGDPTLRDMVSADGNATVILAYTDHYEDIGDKVQLARRMFAALEPLVERRLIFAGTAVVDDAFVVRTERDIKTIIPLVLVTILIVTFLMFRSIWGTLLPTAVIGLTLISVTGLAGLMGIKLNMITTIVIPLAMAVGIADTVHLIAGFREQLALGLQKADALRTAWKKLLFPCFVTSLTTAAGLAALLSATLKPLRQFGWMGAATACFAFVYTLVLIPAVYSIFDEPAGDRGGDAALSRWIGRVTGWVYDHYRFVIVISIALVGFAIAGIPRVETGADFQEYFADNDPLLADIQFVDRNLGGTGGIEVFVEGADIREPEYMARIDATAEYLETVPGLESIMSPASLTRLLHERYFGDPERHTIPSSMAGISQLLTQTEGTDMHDRIMTLDYQRARISARGQSAEYEALIASLDETEAAVAAIWEDSGATARITGIGKLVANLDRYIVSSQLRSFIIAFVMVAILLALFFRSWRLGVWALIPNGMPLILVVGGMGWFGIQLDVATVMVASIMLGLIVDDTVHYLSRLRRESGDGPVTRDVLIRTGAGTGRAILATSVILSTAFLMQLSASFQPNRNFGMMCCAATMVAVTCDLLVLPAVVRAVPFTKSAKTEQPLTD